VRLHDLVAGLDAFELRGESDVDVRTIVHDHRDAREGAMFCCIRGANVDGHLFAPEAVASGAVACLVERWLAVDVPQVRVDSVRIALGPLCARLFGDPSRALRVLGVTGTNGKTTTTYLLEAIGRAAGDLVGIVGTVGARIGDEPLPLRHTTPEATDLQALLAQIRDAGARTVAMEVSSHALDQHRVDGTHFAAVCFTNLSHDHLDYHGTLDEYFEAKARLFDPRFAWQCAINVDDPHGTRLAARAAERGLSVLTFGVDRPDAQVGALEVDIDRTCTRFVLVDRRSDARVDVETSLVGRPNVSNALAAAATALAAGFAFATVADGLSARVRVPGRFEPVEAGADVTVLVDYAHTPDALAAALDVARGLATGSGRVLVVFGCGGDRDRAKRPVMGDVAARRADAVFVTSDNSRSEDPTVIVSEILAGIPSSAPAPVVELDRRRAIRAALRESRAGDVVVIAGKGHESGQTAGDVTVPFDDRVVAREELAART
jgi:UDP-N-acetylmuramoyl-L-alanyl-D-glutamate--2,6-diaminopimelate ligase